MRRLEPRKPSKELPTHRSEPVVTPISSRTSDADPGPADVVRRNWVQLSERVTLRPGDKVRVSGGPYWEQGGFDGAVTKTRMGERGVMVFEEYCEFGESRWVVARGQNGYAALHIGPEQPSSTVPGLMRCPYRLRKVRAAAKQRPVKSPCSGASTKPRTHRPGKAGRRGT